MTKVHQIVVGLSRIGMATRAGRWRQSSAHDLSPIQADILVFIAARGPSRQTALAYELAVSQPTVSDAIAALTRKGLVSARRDPGDGRAKVMNLTTAGQKAADAMTDWSDGIVNAVAAVADEDRPAVMRALVEMVRHLQKSGAIAPQRMCVDCRYFRRNAYPGAVEPHHCDFVDAPFGDAQLRIDCGEFLDAQSEPVA